MRRMWGDGGMNEGYSLRCKDCYGHYKEQTSLEPNKDRTTKIGGHRSFEFQSNLTITLN